ncbi:DUF2971 domain-containing protein [Salmonella enterica]|nr:DUF2971 domain-containing protein [Salmonella enterica]
MNIPSSLYKYTTFENACLTIENQKFKWSSILDFNDPFEARFSLKNDTKNSVRLLAISTMESSEFIKLKDNKELFLTALVNSPDKIIKMVQFNHKVDLIISKYKNNPCEDYLIELEKEINNGYIDSNDIRSLADRFINLPSVLHDQIGKNFGILCLSEIKNQPLMWAHYANNHTGIMFEVNTNQDQSDNLFAKSIKKVSYQDDFPEVTYDMLKGINVKIFPNDAEKFFEKVTLTKQKDWSYENEFRSIKSIKNNNRFVELPKNYFKSITIGCAMPESKEKKITRLVRKNLPDTKIFRNRISRSNYELTQIEI